MRENRTYGSVRGWRRKAPVYSINGLFVFFANEGIEITPISEVEQMIAEKEEQLGVTEELKNAPDVILQSLDVPFEVISKTSE